MQSQNEKAYRLYCVGNPNSQENPLPGISSIEEFLPATETSLLLFSLSSHAFNYMLDEKTRKRNHNDIYNAIFCVEISLTEDEIEKIKQNEEYGYSVDRNRTTILSAELLHYNSATQKYQMTESIGGFCRRMITQDGVRSALNQFIKDDALKTDNYNDINQEILAIFDLLNTQNLEENSKRLLQAVETHTLLLLESILNQRPSFLLKPTKAKIISELTTIKKGLELSIPVLTAPNQNNVEELQSFVEKKAPGKTEYWRIWGGLLLALAASGLFAMCVILAGAPGAGAGGALAVTYMGAIVLSISGKQRGIAKMMNIITDKAQKKLEAASNPQKTSIEEVNATEMPGSVEDSAVGTVSVKVTEEEEEEEEDVKPKDSLNPSNPK